MEIPYIQLSVFFPTRVTEKAMPCVRSSKGLRPVFIPNRTFLVRFGGISGEFGRAMVRIPMVRLNEPDMLPKRTKKVRLGIYRTQIRPKTRRYFFSYRDQLRLVHTCDISISINISISIRIFTLMT